MIGLWFAFIVWYVKKLVTWVDSSYNYLKYIRLEDEYRHDPPEKKKSYYEKLRRVEHDIVDEYDGAEIDFQMTIGRYIDTNFGKN